jgi:microcompartment protein CcmK/EutM
MLLAKVVGTVVATRKDARLEGLKFLLLRQVNPENLKEGGFVVANDAVGCGAGEYVLYASGSSARQTEVTKDRPCDAVIMAIVDTWEIGGQKLYEKHSSEHGYADERP